MYGYLIPTYGKHVLKTKSKWQKILENIVKLVKTQKENAYNVELKRNYFAEL